MFYCQLVTQQSLILLPCKLPPLHRYIIPIRKPNQSAEVSWNSIDSEVDIDELVPNPAKISRTIVSELRTLVAYSKKKERKTEKKRK